MTLIAHPTERCAAVILEGCTATGALDKVTVERWATDLLDIETWAFTRPHPISAGHVIVAWFTRPGLAAIAACRHFTPAGNGPAPFAPTQALTARILPTVTSYADQICPHRGEHTHG